MTQDSKGRLIQIRNGQGNPPTLEVAEFGLKTNANQEELYIGSNSGNLKILTERDSVSIPLATTANDGLLSKEDKVKLNSVETGANNTTIVNNLTSLSTTSALSAYQGKLLKDAIDNIGGGGGGSTVAVVDNLTSTGTTSALSANQGRVIKGLIDNKADKTTATTSANGLMSASDKQKLDGIGSPVNVVNSLTSNSTSDALSAYQGKVLQETKLSGCQESVTKSNTGNAFGKNTVATFLYSTAFGYGCEATADQTFASGSLSKAIGRLSNASGRETIASGINSNSNGYKTEAKNYSSTSFGQFSNMTLAYSFQYSGTADALVLGNGTSDTSLSNAFRVKFDGSVYGRSAYNSSGADYAEYFEWLDGNKDNEDRVGYFVTLDEDKIRKANSSDTYILGVISANPSVVGDASSEGWSEQYVRDDFGRIQYHYVDVEHEEIDENGEKITVIKNEYHPVYNPQYNPQAPYIPREDRKEWDAVGMMGKLLVRDDGTCKVNGYCKPNDDGIATKTIASSNIKYRVMKRVSDNIIQVLVK